MTVEIEPGFFAIRYQTSDDQLAGLIFEYQIVKTAVTVVRIFCSFTLTGKLQSGTEQVS